MVGFDMGGTSTDVAFHGARTRLQGVSRAIAGQLVAVPSLDIHTIGCGGGSLVEVDAGGVLRVGPESAGADPGPVCYGRGGTRPTVTDADLVLGYLDPDFFLGGRMQLDLVGAERAIQDQIGKPLGLSVTEAAWGIHQVVNENMANAARVHAIERAKDPRSFPLFCFGGAGPVHGYRVAEILHTPAMIAPFGAGVSSTVGFWSAPLAFDFVRSAYGQLDELDWDAANEIFAGMEEEGRAVLTTSGVAPEQISYSRSADMRYVGQGHEVRVPVPGWSLGAERRDAFVEAFDRVYQQLYQRAGPAVGLEVVNWRLVVSGPRPELRLAAGEGGSASADDALKGHRRAYVHEAREYQQVPVYDRYRLAPGAALHGPAIVEERESTVIVGPRGRVTIDDLRNLRVDFDR
jgi:N-methylhydantoinase A